MDRQQVLMYSMGNYIQYPMIKHNGKGTLKSNAHTQLIHFTVQQRPTQHCKAITLQQKGNK